MGGSPTTHVRELHFFQRALETAQKVELSLVPSHVRDRPSGALGVLRLRRGRSQIIARRQRPRSDVGDDEQSRAHETERDRSRAGGDRGAREDREHRQERHQVMDLLAADEREDDKPRDDDG
jgi:hypothetical protein